MAGGVKSKIQSVNSKKTKKATRSSTRLSPSPNLMDPDHRESSQPLD
jgi:hypothetical protein